MSRCGCLVRTMFLRFGSGRPKLSNVLRPITTMLPMVICLNHLKSSGKCHGIWLPAPITRFSDIAAMALKCFIYERAFFSSHHESTLRATSEFLRQELLCQADPMIVELIQQAITRLSP